MAISCSVSLNDQNCEYPANLEDGEAPGVTTKCYRCGMPACRACSRMVRWRKGRRWLRIRVCRDCAQHESAEVQQAFEESL